MLVGAQRVLPAVTRLTVYRWPQVMRPGKEEPRWEANKFVASTCFKCDVLAIYLSDHHKNLREHTIHTKEGFLEAHDTPRHGSGV